MADALIFEAVLRDRVEESWFHCENSVCRLSDTGRAKTLEMWVAKVEAGDRNGRH